MFLINNDEFSRVKKELEELVVRIKGSSDMYTCDEKCQNLEKYVLDSKIKIYEMLIKQSIYLNDDIINILKKRLDYCYLLKHDI